MRTTLTIDDDVAAKLKKLSRGGRFKEVANRALRLGLMAMEAREPEAPYTTRPRSGEARIRNLDNIADVLSDSESESWR